jgi:hypothetical protein
MASVTANIAKGREVELYDRVLNNDPANSAIIMGILVSGGDPLATLQDYDTLAAVLAGPSTEAAATGYARKVLTDADLSAWTPDDSLNRVLLTLPQQSWTPNTGETWDIAFTAYDDDTTAGTDSDIIPIAFHEIRENTTGLAMPTITGDTIIVDFSNGWVLNS